MAVAVGAPIRAQDLTNSQAHILCPIPNLGCDLETARAAGVTRRGRCKMCKACRRGDCGKCVACLDKPKFGGMNTMRQSCRARKCTSLGVHGDLGS